MKAVIATIALLWINTSALERGEVDENDVAAAADYSLPRFDNDTPRSAAAPRKSACCNNKMCKDYRGDLSVTVSGRKCQRWDKDFPHHRSSHIRNVTTRREFSLYGNWCRNPTKGKTAWCYTQDPDCCVSKQCKEFRGNRTQTANGNLCQAWSLDYPHERNALVKQMVKESKWATKYLQNNFCRNPTNATTAWCYTKDPSKRWEYCDIKLCKTGTTWNASKYKRSFMVWAVTCSYIVTHVPQLKKCPAEEMSTWFFLISFAAHDMNE